MIDRRVEIASLLFIGLILAVAGAFATPDPKFTVQSAIILATGLMFIALGIATIAICSAIEKSRQES